MLSLVKGFVKRSMCLERFLSIWLKLKRFNTCVREVIGSKARSRVSFGDIKIRATSSGIKDAT